MHKDANCAIVHSLKKLGTSHISSDGEIESTIECAQYNTVHMWNKGLYNL